MLRLVQGRAYLLEDALCEGVKDAMEKSGRDQYVIVPKQLTLQTEQTLIARLHLSGSFQLQVLSAERLCGRIFSAAGYPEGERIDDRGRAILAREAIRTVKGDLTLYKNAEGRRGFAERAAKQFEMLRQGGLTPRTLMECSVQKSGQLSMKLHDLSMLLEAYEKRIAGRYQDGETEFSEAIGRIAEAEFLRNSEVWFYGFDITPPLLTKLMGRVAAAAARTTVLYPVDPNVETRDAEAFDPVRKAMRRLIGAAIDEGCGIEYIRAEERAPQREELRHLERELFAQPTVP